jgi:hypothetical protein
MTSAIDDRNENVENYVQSINVSKTVNNNHHHHQNHNNNNINSQNAKKLSHSRRSIKKTKRASLLTQDMSYIKASSGKTKKRIRRKVRESLVGENLTLTALSSLSSHSGPTTNGLVESEMMQHHSTESVVKFDDPGVEENEENNDNAVSKNISNLKKEMESLRSLLNADCLFFYFVVV